MFDLVLVLSLKYLNLRCPFLLSHPFALWKERDSQCDKNQSASYPVLRSQYQPAALWGLCSLIHAHIRNLCNSSPLSRLKSFWCISLAPEACTNVWHICTSSVYDFQKNHTFPFCVLCLFSIFSPGWVDWNGGDSPAQWDCWRPGLGS